MPVYDYRCRKCEAVFAIEHGMKDAAPRTKPGCASGGDCTLERFYRPVALGKGGASDAFRAQAMADALGSDKPAPKHSCSSGCTH